MRVGMDLTPLTGDRTGVGHFTAYLLRALLPMLGEDRLAGLATGLRALRAVADVAACPVRRLPVPTRVLYQLWNVAGLPRVDTVLGGVDVFHATNYFLPPTRRARRVLTIYDLAFLRAPQWCSPKIVGPFARHVPRFAREADAVLTCSEASKRDIVELLGVPEAKVTVTYGAVDEAFAAPPREEAARRVREEFGVSGPFVLFVGAIEPRKNVTGLLEAFARVRNDLPHRLVLLGRAGWQPEPVPAIAGRLGIADRVTWLGYVPSHAALPAFYAAADAFVLPSFHEGFGLPVIEAMACGCPVITTRRAALPEAGGDAARYADPESPESIAATISEVLGDAALRDRMRALGREQAKRFSWRETARRTLEVYRRVASCA
ncbi:MAG TPA: glycosyltransferase family 1 protein [Candidatus Hydrogenedentes bacterium]|nr:glycosyltransferase family 1 protein [Candidatus Hydrogenedentota bacterium]